MHSCTYSYLTVNFLGTRLSTCKLKTSMSNYYISLYPRLSVRGLVIALIPTRTRNASFPWQAKKSTHGNVNYGLLCNSLIIHRRVNKNISNKSINRSLPVCEQRVQAEKTRTTVGLVGKSIFQKLGQRGRRKSAVRLRKEKVAPAKRTKRQSFCESAVPCHLLASVDP